MEKISRRLLISDLDGTLLFAKGEERVLREKDVQAIRAFQQQGNLMAVNSGRNIGWLTKPLENHIRWDYLIACTGALVVGRTGEDSGQYQVIAQHAMPRTDIQELLEHLENPGDVTFQTMEHVYAMNPKKIYGLPMERVERIGDILEEIYGVSIHHETEEEASQFVAWFRRQQITSIACYQNVNDIDMVARGCSKGTGIQELREHLAISEEQCYVIGDSYNDIEMLKAVPHSFTFHQSSDEVKKSASCLVDSVADVIASIG